MSLPNEFWNSNLSGAVVGGAIGLVAALIASVIPIIWTTHHDRYKRNLEEYDRYLHLSGALLNEINHLRTCVNEALQVVNQYAQNNKVVLPTERLNTEFLKAARLQLATISSSSGIFPSVTRALQEVDHCNGMLDRYENEGRKIGLPAYSLRDFAQSGVVKETENLLRSTITLLEDVRGDIENSRTRVSASKPRLFPWLAS